MVIKQEEIYWLDLEEPKAIAGFFFPTSAFSLPCRERKFRVGFFGDLKAAFEYQKFWK